MVSTAEARSRCSDMNFEMLQDSWESWDFKNPVKLGSRQIPVWTIVNHNGSNWNLSVKLMKRQSLRGYVDLQPVSVVWPGRGLFFQLTTYRHPEICETSGAGLSMFFSWGLLGSWKIKFVAENLRLKAFLWMWDIHGYPNLWFPEKNLYKRGLQG